MRIHYFAAARSAAGVAEENVETAATLGELIDGATARHPELANVVNRCSFLVDGRRASLDDSLSDAARVDVLPPFAGG